MIVIGCGLKFLEDGSATIIQERIRRSRVISLDQLLPINFFKSPSHYLKNQWHFTYDLEESNSLVYSCIMSL